MKQYPDFVDMMTGKNTLEGNLLRVSTLFLLCCASPFEISAPASTTRSQLTMTWAAPWVGWELQSHQLSLYQVVVTFCTLDTLGVPQSLSFQLGKNQSLLKRSDCCPHKKLGGL